MPIDFEPSDETRAVVKGVTDFADKHAGELEERFPRFLEDEQAYLREDGRLDPEIVDAIDALRRKSAEAGFYALSMPEEVGGGGRPMVDLALAMSALAERGFGFHPMVVAGVEGPSPMLMAMDEDQRDRWLRPLCNAEVSTAFCLTEPGAGSDVGKLATRAEPDGDGWRLSGTKTYITNGPYADFYEVFARTSGEEGLEGLSLFIVDPGADGVEIGEVQQTILADGLQCEVRFDDAYVEPDRLVGPEDQGFMLAIQNIGFTRVLVGALCVGLGRFCLKHAISYANEREAFGRPIGKLQGVSFPIAEAATKLHAAEKMLLDCAWKIDQDQDVVRESSMVKLYCTEILQEIADTAIQVHGGNGLMKELPIERVFRAARVLRIPEGTSEVQKATIAKTLGL